MLIGVPKEIKSDENRVGLLPGAVRELVHEGRAVLVEAGAGLGVGAGDDVYRAVGAAIAPTAVEVFARADLIVKVKEPQPVECAMLREGQILFTYLHLAADSAQAHALARSGSVCIAYETVTDARDRLPLLAPMSEVAGRMAIQVAARCQEIHAGGEGVLLGGVPGVPAARVVVLGGGVAGTHAARIALGVGAKVTVIDKSLPRLEELDALFGPQLSTLYATVDSIEQAVATANVVIGAVLVPGASAPKLVSRDMVARMSKGAVIVDIAIDQGGCFETSRPTTHRAPTYVEEGVVHYCVTNMPGAVARTSAQALNNATLPFVSRLAAKGWKQALADDPHLRRGLNVCMGFATHQAVADAVGLPYRPAEELVAA
jgi:alanine dehydrogenase